MVRGKRTTLTKTELKGGENGLRVQKHDVPGIVGIEREDEEENSSVSLRPFPVAYPQQVVSSKRRIGSEWMRRRINRLLLCALSNAICVASVCSVKRVMRRNRSIIARYSNKEREKPKRKYNTVITEYNNYSCLPPNRMDPLGLSVSKRHSPDRSRKDAPT